MQKRLRIHEAIALAAIAVLAAALTIACSVLRGLATVFALLRRLVTRF